MFAKINEGITGKIAVKYSKCFFSGLDSSETVYIPSYWFTSIFMVKRGRLMTAFEYYLNKLMCNVISIIFNVVCVYAEPVTGDKLSK